MHINKKSYLVPIEQKKPFYIPNIKIIKYKLDLNNSSKYNHLKKINLSCIISSELKD